MKVSKEEACRIADLAHLEFDDASLDRLAAEMTKILGYIEQLPDDDVMTVSSIETLHKSKIQNPKSKMPLRDDVVAATLDMGDFFVVPKVIE